MELLSGVGPSSAWAFPAKQAGREEPSALEKGLGLRWRSTVGLGLKGLRSCFPGPLLFQGEGEVGEVPRTDRGGPAYRVGRQADAGGEGVDPRLPGGQLPLLKGLHDLPDLEGPEVLPRRGGGNLRGGGESSSEGKTCSFVMLPAPVPCLWFAGGLPALARRGNRQAREEETAGARGAFDLPEGNGKEAARSKGLEPLPPEAAGVHQDLPPLKLRTLRLNAQRPSTRPAAGRCRPQGGEEEERSSAFNT